MKFGLSESKSKSKSEDPFTILERLVRSLKSTPQCTHQFQDVNEIDGWSRCQDCGEFFPYEELDFTDDMPPCWTQHYSSKNHFSKFVKQLQVSTPSLPSGDLALAPLQSGFCRFEEAYRACRFLKGGKVIGSVRCVFPPSYIVFQLANTLHATDPNPDLCGWADWARAARALVAPGRRAELDVWWEQINAQMPDCWQRKTTRSLERFKRSKSELKLAKCASS